MEGELATRETWRTTHSLDLDRSSPISHQLASPRDRFGVHVTADAFGEGFVVAYEDRGTRYTLRFTHNSVEPEGLNPWILTLDPTSHSPFVSIPPGDEKNRRVFFTKSNPLASTSEIVTTRCSEPPTRTESACDTETVVFKSTKRIRRTWVELEPGRSALGHALFSWQEGLEPKTGLSVARLDATNATQEREVTSTETFGEAFFIAPNQLLNAVYLQNPTPAEPATPKDAYVQPLCNF